MSKSITKYLVDKVHLANTCLHPYQHKCDQSLDFMRSVKVLQS